MTNTAPHIPFDPLAYKTRSIEGPFGSKTELIAACETVSDQNAEWLTYQQNAVNFGVDPATGNMVWSVNSPLYQKTRQTRLSAQLDAFKTDESIVYKSPETLAHAFKAVAAYLTQFPLKVLMISTAQTSFFDLRKLFPQLSIHATCAAANEDDAQICNDLIQTKIPGLSNELVFKSDWQGQSYDLVSIDFSIMYENDDSIRTLAENIRNTGAERVVMTNIMPNSTNETQWLGQRAYGGIIPLRIPTREGLTALMNEMGYQLAETQQGDMTFKPLAESAFASQPQPQRENLTFVRKPSPV